MNRRLRAVALGAVIAAGSAGCVILEVRDTSRPAIGSDRSAPERWLDAPGVRLTAYARHDRSVASLVGPAIGVPLPVIPIPSGERPPAKHFWIDVGVDPEGEDFTFDVRQVRLRLADGATLPPSAVVGPVMYDLHQLRQPAICLAHGAPERTPATVAIRELACLSLRFDAAPPPPTDPTFTLTLDGLANRGQPLAPAVIGFEHRRIKRLDFAP
jgi:hypothetical protein